MAEGKYPLVGIDGQGGSINFNKIFYNDKYVQEISATRGFHPSHRGIPLGGVKPKT